MPSQAAQGPIQPGLEHLQGWTGHPQLLQHLTTLPAAPHRALCVTARSLRRGAHRHRARQLRDSPAGQPDGAPRHSPLCPQAALPARGPRGLQSASCCAACAVTAGLGSGAAPSPEGRKGALEFRHLACRGAVSPSRPSAAPSGREMERFCPAPPLGQRPELPPLLPLPHRQRAVLQLRLTAGRHSTAQHSTAQRSTALHSTAQYSAAASGRSSGPSL